MYKMYVLCSPGIRIIFDTEEEAITSYVADKSATSLTELTMNEVGELKSSNCLGVRLTNLNNK